MPKRDETLIGPAQRDTERDRVGLEGAEIAENGVVVPEAERIADPSQLDTQVLFQVEVDLSALETGTQTGLIDLADLRGHEAVDLDLAGVVDGDLVFVETDTLEGFGDRQEAAEQIQLGGQRLILDDKVRSVSQRTFEVQEDVVEVEPVVVVRVVADRLGEVVQVDELEAARNQEFVVVTIVSDDGQRSGQQEEGDRA